MHRDAGNADSGTGSVDGSSRTGQLLRIEEQNVYTIALALLL